MTEPTPNSVHPTTSDTTTSRTTTSDTTTAAPATRTRRPFRFGYLAMEPAASAQEWRRRAHWVQEHGFSTFQVSDHFDRSPASPLPVLAWVAAHTEGLRLGTLVLGVDFRQPAVLAKELATVDMLSQGRLEIGMGAGWMPADYESAGIPLERPGLRIERLAEALTILDHGLRSESSVASASAESSVVSAHQPERAQSSQSAAPTPVTWTGRHYAVQGLRTIPGPVQAPRPPLLVGGGGRRVLSLAGERADIVSINLMVNEGRVGEQAARSAAAAATRQKIDWVRQAAGARFTELELHLLIYWVAVTEGDRLEAAERLIAQRGFAFSPAELLASPHSLIGPHDMLVEKLQALREDYGFSYVSFYDSDAMQLRHLVTQLHGS